MGKSEIVASFRQVVASLSNGDPVYLDGDFRNGDSEQAQVLTTVTTIKNAEVWN